MAGVCSVNEQNCNDRVARKSLLQSGTCQAGVNSCQVGLLAAPLPRARAAEGGPHTHLRQQITSAETHVRRQGCAP